MFGKKISENEYVRKLEEKNRFYNSLEKINKAIASSLDVESILQMIFKALDENLKYKSSLLIVDKENKRLVAKSIEGKTFALIKIFLKDVKNVSVPLYSTESENDGLAIQCAREGQVFTSGSMYEVVKPLVSKLIADNIQRAIGVKYGAVIPVNVKNETIAVLTIGSKAEITEENIEVLKSFADLAGVAINNAQLFEQVQNQAKQYDDQAHDLKALFGAVRTSTEILDQRRLAQKIVDSIPENLGHLSFLAGMLTLVDREKNENRAYAITSNPVLDRALQTLKLPYDQYASNLDTGDSVAIRSIRNKRIYTVAELSELISTNVLPPLVLKSIQKLIGMKSGAAVPVIVRDKTIGSLVFTLSCPTEEISRRHEEIMWSFASQVGIAIENARLYEEERSRAAKLDEVNKELVRIDNVKSEFLSIASHQLRTPLSAIKGYLSMVKAGDFGPVPSSQQEVIDIVYENTNRLIQLVSDFLNVSRIEGGRLKVDFTVVKLKDTISHIVKELELVANTKKIQLTIDENSMWPVVKVDAMKITEVFTNLIDNAIKYTPQGSVEISTEIQRPYLIVKVKDTGVGIAADEIPHLFQKFARGKNSNRVNTTGTGIGLYVVKNLLKVQNADVWVESPGEGKGSTFYVKLPLA